MKSAEEWMQLQEPKALQPAALLVVNRQIIRSIQLDTIQAAALEKWPMYSSRTSFDTNLWLRAKAFNKLIIELTAADWCEAFLETCKEIEK